MRMRHGINPILEEEANRLIKESLAGTKSHTAKRDILTPWKEKDRRRREVYSRSGTIDPAIRNGQYNRSKNASRPHLNSNEKGVHTGVPDADRGDPSASLRIFVEGQRD